MKLCAPVMLMITEYKAAGYKQAQHDKKIALRAAAYRLMNYAPLFFFYFALQFFH